jgi:hypothetical protein
MKKPRASRRRKPGYTDITRQEVNSRWLVWWPVLFLHPWYRGLGRTAAQVAFAEDNGCCPREFQRWLSRHRTHAPGGPKDLEYREKIELAYDQIPVSIELLREIAGVQVELLYTNAQLGFPVPNSWLPALAEAVVHTRRLGAGNAGFKYIV